MFENANLNHIYQTLEGLNIDEYNFLKENVNYISTYNASNYLTEDVLWSNDTAVMFNIMNTILKFRNVRLRFNSMNYRNVTSNRERLESEIKDTASNVTNILYFPSGIVRAISYLKDEEKLISDENRLKNIELTLTEDGKHIVKIYKYNEKTFIFTNNYSWNFLRKIISLIPIFNNIEFEEEEVKDIFKYYGALDYENWIASINKWYAKNNFKKRYVTKSLKKLFEAQINRKKENITNSIENKETRISEYEDVLAKLYKEVNELKNTIRLMALMPDYSEIVNSNIDYLINNKVLRVLHVYPNDSKLLIQVNAPAKYYDIKYLEKYFDKGTVISYDNVKRLLKEIYIDNLYELIFATKFVVNIKDCKVSATDKDNRYLGGFPHPHIMRFNCWGDNKTYIHKSLAEQDTIGALEQCIAACYNLNFSDVTVVETMSRNLNSKYRNIKCIKDKEGNLFTPSEIYRKYREEEKEQENNEVYNSTES